MHPFMVQKQQLMYCDVDVAIVAVHIRVYLVYCWLSRVAHLCWLTVVNVYMYINWRTANNMYSGEVGCFDKEAEVLQP